MITYTNHPAQRYDLRIACHYCGRKLISAKTPPGTVPYYELDDTGAPVLVDAYGIMTLDHRLAKARGGSNTSCNLAPCCKVCNYRKDSGDYDDFYEALTAERTARQLEQALDLLRSAAGIVPKQEYVIAGRALHFAAAQMRQIAALEG